MSRDQKIKIAMVICGMVLACALILNFTGGFGTQGLGSYANADKYTAGETEIRDTVRNLDINWTSGKSAAWRMTRSCSGGWTAIRCGCSSQNPVSAGICRGRN